VRGRSGVRRVGHAGTLDPAAEGVLPVCLGQGTRIIEYLMDARKTYVATVRLGVVTDTYDAEGQVLAETPAEHVSREAVEQALTSFRGEIEQAPPPFSAIKRDGVPLYRYARAGLPVDVAPRQVTVYRLELTSFRAPLVSLEIECGKGTYVRSLAHDIGALLGVGGRLEALTRTRVGPFRIGDAVSIDTLRVEFESGDWRQRLLAIDEVLLEWPAAIVGQESATRLRRGQSAPLELLPAWSARPPQRCRAYGNEGDFLAVLRDDGGRWRPEKVFAPASTPR